jgi:hypothetical protein
MIIELTDYSVLRFMDSVVANNGLELRAARRELARPRAFGILSACNRHCVKIREQKEAGISAMCRPLISISKMLKYRYRHVRLARWQEPEKHSLYIFVLVWILVFDFESRKSLLLLSVIEV